MSVTRSSDRWFVTHYHSLRLSTAVELTVDTDETVVDFATADKGTESHRDQTFHDSEKATENYSDA
ncbi:hypothetical protein SIIN_18_T [Serendipita indica DSM 11827]|nr:hypothetical protein SIIN_18_T [Serendipita indica DSM 11827]